MLTNDYNIVLPHSGEATLFVFGDMQFGSDGFDNEMWEQFKAEFKSTKNAYAIGLGDYDDFIRFTVRKPLVQACYGDSNARAQLDKMVMGRIDEILKKMSFMKGKIVGLHAGHHEWDFASGMTTSQLLCHDLKCAYLDWTAYTVLRISTKPKPATSNTVAIKIFSTHGSGGSSFSSTDMGNLERKIAPYWVSDIYLRGHSSKHEMIPMELNDVTVKGPGKPRIIKKTRWAVNTGGFMKGYPMGAAGYVEQKAMPPACLGWSKVVIKFRTDLKGLDGKRRSGVSIQPILVSPSIIENEPK